jgi:hypothetical protein
VFAQSLFQNKHLIDEAGRYGHTHRMGAAHDNKYLDNASPRSPSSALPWKRGTNQQCYSDCPKIGHTCYFESKRFGRIGPQLTILETTIFA